MLKYIYLIAQVITIFFFAGLFIYSGNYICFLPIVVIVLGCMKPLIEDWSSPSIPYPSVPFFVPQSSASRSTSCISSSETVPEPEEPFFSEEEFLF